MTRETARKHLPMIQAFAEGKSVQYLSDGQWVDCKSPCFTDPNDTYRVKPEPREWIVPESIMNMNCYYKGTYSLPLGFVKVREVLP